MILRCVITTAISWSRNVKQKARPLPLPLAACLIPFGWITSSSTILPVYDNNPMPPRYQPSSKSSSKRSVNSCASSQHKAHVATSSHSPVASRTSIRADILRREGWIRRGDWTVESVGSWGRSTVAHCRWFNIPQSQQQSTTNDVQGENGYVGISENIEDISELNSVRNKSIRQNVNADADVSNLVAQQVW